MPQVGEGNSVTKVVFDPSLGGMAAPGLEAQAADLLPTQTREKLGTVRSHPRVRITGSSQRIRVSASIARRYRTCRCRHQAPL